MFGLAARLIGGMVTPLIDQASATSARLLRKLALFVVAALAMVVVLIALTIAFDLWVASKAGPIAGALAVAGLYGAVAAVAVVLALRKDPPKAAATKADAPGVDEKAAGKRDADKRDMDSEIDAFAAPLLAMLRNLGLRREQLAVLAGTSVAKQVGPLPLVGLAIVAGFLLGRFWSGWRGLLSSDLVETLLASDLLAGLFGAKAKPPEDKSAADEGRDAA